MADEDLRDFVRRLPKAELHLHIEGSLEPEMMFALAKKHAIPLRHDSVEAVRRAYSFHNLQSFLDIYYEGAAVLRDESDFHDLTLAYLRRAHADGVVHTEIFFDPQTHTNRGVSFGTVIRGIDAALEKGRRELGVTSRLIMCFLRDQSQDAAMATLEEALPFRDRIAAVGLDSAEVGHPPSKFVEVFARAKKAGFRAVAHAGEEGPPAYIWEALDLLGVERIDHGVRCESDDALCARLVKEKIPLTVCPLSNLKLAVVRDLKEHNIGRLLARGLAVTVNSDDPAYFGGYVLDNYVAVARALDLSRASLAELARHSIRASFLSDSEKAGHLARIDAQSTTSVR